MSNRKVIIWDGQSEHYRLASFKEAPQGRLPPGIYHAFMSYGVIRFEEKKIVTDVVRETESPVLADVQHDVDVFWSPEVQELYRDYGLVHNRGLLLYGIPGTGKTTLLVKLARNFVEQGGVVLYDTEPDRLVEAVKNIREAAPDQKILVLFEELEDLIDRYESDLLSILDGEDKFDQIMFLATTNYLKKVPVRFSSRPSRFARVVEVPPPAPAARAHFIRNFLKPKDLERFPLNSLVARTEGMTIDHIKNFLISMLCFRLGLDVAEARVREIMAEEQKED